MYVVALLSVHGLFHRQFYIVIFILVFIISALLNFVDVSHFY